MGRPAKSFLLVGLRGVGKTVLLNRLRELSEEADYKALIIEAPENRRLPALLIPHLRKLLLSLDRIENISTQVKRGLGALRSFASVFKITLGEVDFGVTVDNEIGIADSGDLEIDLPDLFVAIGEAAQARGIPAAIFIDEMQYLTETELSALIMAMHQIEQRRLPFILVGAGLPQLVGLAGKSKSYAERLFNFPKIDALGDRDARSALSLPVQKEGVRFEPQALDEIMRVTRGYPYFLQVWGYRTWNLATRSPITLGTVKGAHDAVLRDLDSNFFRVRFDRLTPREKDYLRAMAELGSGSHRSGDIAEIMEVEVRSVAPLRANLIKKGMIYSPAHGDTAFTVPLFDEYMKRIIPKIKRSKASKLNVPPE
jgi:hypothetical protein